MKKKKIVSKTEAKMEHSSVSTRWVCVFLSFLLSTLQKQSSVWIAAVPFKLHFFAKEIICQKLDEHA